MPYQSSFYSNNQLYATLVYAGAYSASTLYGPSVVVAFNGGSYICIGSPPVGTDPTNTTYWAPLALPGTAAAGGTPGQALYNDAGTVGGFTVAGDGTLDTATGDLVVTKTNGVAFAPSATTDTTDASNITSGTLPNAQVPAPSTTVLGGIKAIAAVTSQWINAISTGGVPSLTQPAFSDLSGSAAAGQLPADVLYSDVADQTISGGATVTSKSLTAGSLTIDPGACPLQYIPNTAAFTITAPANDGSCMLMITNGTGAGAVSFTGFSVGGNTGDTLDTTSGHIFTISIWRINGVSGYRVAAHQ